MGCVLPEIGEMVADEAWISDTIGGIDDRRRRLAKALVSRVAFEFAERSNVLRPHPFERAWALDLFQPQKRIVICHHSHSQAESPARLSHSPFPDARGGLAFPLLPGLHPPAGDRWRNLDDCRIPHLHHATGLDPDGRRPVRPSPAGTGQIVAARRLLAYRSRPAEPDHPRLAVRKLRGTHESACCIDQARRLAAEYPRVCRQPEERDLSAGAVLAE